MANINDIYGSSGALLTSKIVKNDDLEDLDLTIIEADIGEFNKNYDDPNDETKIKKVVLGFEEIEQQLAVNKTNAGILAKSFGDDTDDWIGNVIQFILVETSVGTSIQVRIPKKRKPKSKVKAKKTPNFERLAKKNEAIEKALSTVQLSLEEDEDATMGAIVTELKAMKLEGEITKEEFGKAGQLLGYE